MKTDILQIKLFDYLLEIPKGKITTYQKLGEIFEVHPRKIGKIVKNNLDTDMYPCYKVLENESKIGFYNGKGGIPGKVQKIKDDGVEVVDGKIDAQYFI